MTEQVQNSARQADEADIEKLLAQLTLEEKVALLSGRTSWRLRGNPRIGLREIVMSDGPVGIRGETWDERRTSLCVPSPTALAASWDKTLVRRIGALLAAEARRRDVDVLLAPTMNMHRTPFGGRHFECYSEDPLLAGEIGTAYVQGVQSHGVATTPKHYVANDAETERQTVDNRIDDRALHEVYLAPFEAVVRAGAWAVMSAYNGVNGTSMTEHDLLREPLKSVSETGWGFDGVVISDWFATYDTVNSALAAQDVEMPGPSRHWADRLVAAVRDGRVPESAVDDKARRVLRLAVRVHALDGSAPVTSPSASGEDASLIRQAAAAGMVLAVNNGLLPLEPARLQRIAVIGPAASTPRIQGGGSATVFPPYLVSPLAGLRAALPHDVEVVFARGCGLSEDPVPIDSSTCTNPATGEPGVLAELFDADGNLWRREDRLSSRILWQDPDFVNVRTIRLSAVMTAPVDGVWQLGIIGAGSYRFEVDGVLLIDEDLRTTSPDPGAALFEPPHSVRPVTLTRGQQVTLSATLTISTPGTEFAVGFGAAQPRELPAVELSAAVTAARTSDIAVVIVGTSAADESEGFDRTSLALPGAQDALVEAVAAANPNTIVVVNSGAPVLTPWRSSVSAVLLCWFPGQEFGAALADVLLGVVEPGGRLPTTWPDVANSAAVLSATPTAGRLDYEEGVHIGYRGWLRTGEQPAWWFGHGLGYTNWALADPVVTHDEPGVVTVQVTLSNTGDRTGRQVVQCYLARPDSALDRPARWLAAFAAETLEAKETRTVTLSLPQRALEHWTGNGWAVEPGRFEVFVGFSAGDGLITAGAVDLPAENS